MGEAVRARPVDLQLVDDLLATGEAPKLQPGDPLVYYVLKDGLAKIGMTSAFHTRMLALRPDEVLAVELGSFGLETARRAQFADDHAKGRDWFRPSSLLLAHAELIAAIYGPPPEWNPRPRGGDAAARRIARARRNAARSNLPQT